MRISFDATDTSFESLLPSTQLRTGAVSWSEFFLFIYPTLTTQAVEVDFLTMRSFRAILSFAAALCLSTICVRSKYNQSSQSHKGKRNLSQEKDDRGNLASSSRGRKTAPHQRDPWTGEVGWRPAGASCSASRCSSVAASSSSRQVNRAGEGRRCCSCCFL